MHSSGRRGERGPVDHMVRTDRVEDENECGPVDHMLRADRVEDETQVLTFVLTYLFTPVLKRSTAR